MRTRYALAALGLFLAPGLVQAQNRSYTEAIVDGDTLLIDNPIFPTTFNQPQLTVTSSSNSSLDRVFNNVPVAVLEDPAEDPMFDEPYTAPNFADPDGQFTIGASAFTCFKTFDNVGDAGCAPAPPSTIIDTEIYAKIFDLAPPVFEGGPFTDDATGITYEGTVTGNLVLADPVLGCEPGATPSDPAFPVELDNADAIDGNIALIERGGCGFSLKVTSAQRAGARGVIIYIPNTGVYTDLRAAVNMAPIIGVSGSVDYTGLDGDLLVATDSLGLTIPSFLIPFGVASPIVDELDFGGEVEVTMGVSPFEIFLDQDGDGNIDEETPGLTDFNTIAGSAIVTAIEDVDLPQGETALKTYPNPTSGLARVALATATPEVVRVEVYNTLGQRVAVLHDGMITGQVDLDLDASQFATGLYLVRATGETFSQTTRVTVAR